MNVSGQHVLVIGTEVPWLEASILESGAEKVTTLGKEISTLVTKLETFFETKIKKKSLKFHFDGFLIATMHK